MLINDPTIKWQALAAVVKQHKRVLISKPRLSHEYLVFYRILADSILLFLLQYIGLTLTTLTLTTSPLWLASGTAAAYIFLRGPISGYGIWLGSFFAYYFAHAGVHIAFFAATLFTLQPLFLLFFCYRFVYPTLLFNHYNILNKFIILSAFITGLISYLLLYISYSALTTIHSFLFLWLEWWLANINGLLIFGLALISWDAYFPQISQLKVANKTSLCLHFGALIFTLMLFGMSTTFYFMGIFGALTIALTLLISKNWGHCGGMTAIFISGFLISLIAMLNTPPSGHIEMSGKILFLQTFLYAQTIFVLYFIIEKTQPNDV